MNEASKATRPVPYLRLVTDEFSPEPEAGLPKDEAAAQQLSLGLDDSRARLELVPIERVSAHDLRHLITEVQPRFAFDLRPVPWFLIDNLNRTRVFRLFELHDVRYYDVAGIFDIDSTSDAAANPYLLIPRMVETLLAPQCSLVGPVLFFINQSCLRGQFVEGIADSLPHADGCNWEVTVWGEHNELRLVQ